MATRTVSSPGMTIGIRVDDAAVLHGLRAARRDLRPRMKRIQEDAATDVVMPRVRQLSPSFAKGKMVARATSSAARVTTIARGMDRRRIGLHEYGGTVKTVLRPKRPGVRAIPVAPGVFRANVKGPRHHTAHSFMRAAVNDRFAAYCARLRDDVSEWLLDEITRRGVIGGRR